VLPVDETGGLIHNHLINNFFLGNKKALFYNLREYYSLSGDNLYNYIPLTFHIRRGMKDQEYTKFVDFYKRRQRLIEQDQRR
jgi:tubulin monoglycylase TTLL3/8